jgi:hypothetical protein
MCYPKWSPLLFNFALEHSIGTFQVSQVRLKLNGTHQLLAYAEDVNLFGGYINTIEKNVENLIGVSREVRPEIDVEITKYILQSRYQNVG